MGLGLRVKGLRYSNPYEGLLVKGGTSQAPFHGYLYISRVLSRTNLISGSVNPTCKYPCASKYSCRGCSPTFNSLDSRFLGKDVGPLPASLRRRKVLTMRAYAITSHKNRRSAKEAIFATPPKHYPLYALIVQIKGPYIRTLGRRLGAILRAHMVSSLNSNPFVGREAAL